VKNCKIVFLEKIVINFYSIVNENEKFEIYYFYLLLNYSPALDSFLQGQDFLVACDIECLSEALDVVGHCAKA
jgi:hypothetical protein